MKTNIVSSSSSSSSSDNSLILSNINQNETNIVYDSIERIKIGHLLYIGSCKLDYPNTSAAISIIIMHKYYNFLTQYKNINEIYNDKMELIASILFLVGKLSENLRSMNDVINVTTWLYTVQNKIENDSNSNEITIKNIIVKEHFLLRVLGFNVHIDIPHSYLLQYSKRYLLY
jgi:hypothetical protein